MRARLALVLIAVCAAVTAWLVACGSSSRSAPVTEGDAAEEPIAVVHDAQAEEGESTETGTETGSETGVDAGTTGTGVITFSEAPDAAGTFFAGFTESPLPQAAPGCTVVDAGACTTVSCSPVPLDAGEAGAPDAALAAAPNPGTLQLTGGAFRDAGITVGPDKAGTYLYASPGTLFDPGDTLGVSGLGAQLPAFSRQTTVALPVVQLTAPTADGGAISIDTSAPLTVSWTGGQAGAALLLSATAVFTTGGQATMTCTWDASSGTVSVPSTALEPLAAQNALTSGLGWYQASSTHFATGPVAVTMTAYIAQQVPASFR